MCDTLREYTVSVEVRLGALVTSVESKSEGWKEKELDLVFGRLLNRTQVAKPALLTKVHEAE
jgi:hypothetical protein